MKRLLGLVAAVITSAGVLTGCGGSDDYCDSLEETVEEFEAVDEGETQDLEESVEAFRDLGDEAPSEVEEEWETLIGAFDEAESALEDAGVSFSDLDEIEGGQMPEGVDEAELMEAFASFEELSSEEYTEANDAIEEHAESECGVTLPG